MKTKFLSKKFEYGIRGIIPTDVAESRIIPFILSTNKRDRHGTVLNQDNWFLENYRKNPIVAYQHNITGDLCTGPDPDNIIGKSIRTEIEGRPGERQLVAYAQFESGDINPLAEKIFRKVLFGSLSRCSVGFIEIGQGHYGNGDEAKGAENETYYFEGQELVEWSIVALPSNPDTGRRDMLMRKLRDEAYGALMYAFKELGGKFRLSQLEQFRVFDILNLLDGKDLELNEKDPKNLISIFSDPIVIMENINNEIEILKTWLPHSNKKEMLERQIQLLKLKLESFKLDYKL